MENNEIKKAMPLTITVEVQASVNYSTAKANIVLNVEGMNGGDIDKTYKSYFDYLTKIVNDKVKAVGEASNPQVKVPAPKTETAKSTTSVSDVDAMSLEDIEKLSIKECKSSNGRPIMTLKDREEILGSCTAKELAYLGGGIFISTKYNEETEEVTKTQNDPSQVMTSTKSAAMIKVRQGAKKLYLARQNAKVKGYKEIQWVI